LVFAVGCSCSTLYITVRRRTRSSCYRSWRSCPTLSNHK